MKKIREEFGGLDILVNNAGTVVDLKSLEGMTLEFYRKVSAINLESMILVIKEALSLMKDRGGASIINLSSQCGRQGGITGSMAYCITKGAILTMTRSLATELAPYGIRVNAVAPGIILGTQIQADHFSERLIKKMIAGIPIGRAGTCEDVARAVTFLGSEYNGFITGSTLDINGGSCMV